MAAASAARRSRSRPHGSSKAATTPTTPHGKGPPSCQCALVARAGLRNHPESIVNLAPCEMTVADACGCHQVDDQLHLFEEIFIIEVGIERNVGHGRSFPRFRHDVSVCLIEPTVAGQLAISPN